MTLPNGALTSFGYDAAGRIESIVTTAASGVIAESYTRDAAGRVTADSSGAYAYDDAGRLASWTAPDATVTTYTYDAASNLTGASVDGSATASFAYDAADRITSPGFTFDDAGNLTCDGERLFTYDAACRLVAVADASTETTIATYTYDAFNRRTSSGLGDLNRTYYHYDGASSRVIAEQTFGAPTTTFTYDNAGSLFSMTRAGETYYYHLNARGDVVAMSDSTGDVVNTYSYDPWGTLLSENETVVNPYRYASYRYDSATGLYYCWNRYYAPELARFLTRDIYPGELSDPVTMNPYLYCGADPVSRVDPSGMLHFFVWEVNAGEQVALDAVDYWAEKSIQPDNTWFETAGATTMGVLAAYWSPKASDWTFTAVSLCFGGAAAKSGGYNAKIGLHPPHHGLTSHLQINAWRAGVSGSGWRWATEVPIAVSRTHQIPIW